MTTDPQDWRRFARTVETVEAVALAEADMSEEASGTSGQPETFIALAAAPLEETEAPVSLRNGRRDLTITLHAAEGGVRVEVEASGYQAKRVWSKAAAEIQFAATGVSARLKFDGEARAEALIADARLGDLARDKIALEQIRL